MKIIALTEPGLLLAKQIARRWENAEICYQPKPFAETVQQAFQAGEPLVMICATGIAVRVLAPVLASKHSDPPVLVLDENGQFIVPLLSGHEGGANELARQLAEHLAGQLVITTAQPYVYPIYTLGMGCERGCLLEDLQALAEQCLRQAGIQWADLYCLASIEVKQDETGLIQLAKLWGKPFNTWPASDLKSVEHCLSTKSQYVHDTVGVYGVAESAALYSASITTGKRAELVITKQKSQRATCSIARSFGNEN